MAEVKKKLGEFQLHYGFETLGLQRKPGDSPPDPETALERGLAGDTVCVGDPDDMIAFLHRLEERSGGFGGLMIQAQEFATREQVNHSYELILALRHAALPGQHPRPAAIARNGDEAVDGERVDEPGSGPSRPRALSGGPGRRSDSGRRLSRGPRAIISAMPQRTSE